MKWLPFLVVASAVLASQAVFLPQALAADVGDRYWVVGSFKTLVSATRESARIENLTGLPVRIARFDLESGRLYRLVIPQDADPDAQKRALDSEGIETWSVPLVARQLEFEQPGDASTDKYNFHLIVAAYRDEGRANAYVSSLAGLGVSNAKVLTAGAGLYRVGLGPYASRDENAKQDAAAIGVADSWWLESVGVVAAPGPIAKPKPARVATRSARPIMPVLPKEPEKPKAEERTISPPLPGESYVDYCVGRATAQERDMFCTNGRFSQRIADGASGSTLIEFCASASASERAKYCDNQTFAARVIP